MKLRAGPTGVHFFSRTTGLNVLCEEVRTPPSSWATAPRQVSIALTNRCDLSCAYCYAPKNRSRLDYSQLTSWLSEFDANGCLGVGFGGGEPTLYQNFVPLCHHVATNTGLAVTFTTHAHRVDHQLVDALKGCIHFVRVSIDGIGSTYERMRGRSFVALRSRLDLVRTLAPLGINFVVNSVTITDLDGAIHLASEIGATELLLLPERGINGRSGIDAITRAALSKWIHAYSGAIPLCISELDADASVYPIFTAEKGLRAYAHIDASGCLKRSSFDIDGRQIGSDGVISTLLELKKQLGEEDVA